MVGNAWSVLHLIRTLPTLMTGSIAEDQLVEEEIDSLKADVESPSVATDSDSLTGCA